MCCGQKRMQASVSLPDSTRSSSPTSTPPAPVAQGDRLGSKFRPTISVRYVESRAIQVRGPATGTIYRFSAAQPVQAVDARDAGLLASRVFRLA